MTHETSDAPDLDHADEADRIEHRGNLLTLEAVFLSVVAAVTVVAFVQALGYQLVSSRTPLVIMAPLMILIVIHARRLLRLRESLGVRDRIAVALRGRNETLNKAAGFSGWMVALVVAITVLGHYVAIFGFCLILMLRAGERWLLSLIVAAGATLFIWGVFEVAFNIDLYRGLIVRYFLGYRDFQA